MIIRSAVQSAKFTCHELGISEGLVKCLRKMETWVKVIHGSVAMRTWRMIDDQEKMNFFWDMKCDGIRPDNRRRWASVLLEDSVAVFFKWSVMIH